MLIGVKPRAPHQAPYARGNVMQPHWDGQADRWGARQLWAWCTLGLRLVKRNSQARHYKHTAARSLLRNTYPQTNLHTSGVKTRIGSHLYEASAQFPVNSYPWPTRVPRQPVPKTICTHHQPYLTQPVPIEWGLSADCGQSYQPLHSQSPSQRKRKSSFCRGLLMTSLFTQ